MWVLGDELLGGVEQGGDGGLELEHGQHPAVDQAVLAHEGERVVGDVAPKLDVGLDAPVPVVFFQGLLVIEEARVETAHVAVRQRAAVDDALRLQLPHALIDPRAVERGGDAPVGLGDLHVFNRAAGQTRGVFDELESNPESAASSSSQCAEATYIVGEGLVVHKRPRILVVAVKTVFDHTHGAQCLVQFAVPTVV